MASRNFHSLVRMVSKSMTVHAGGSVKSIVDPFIYRAIAMIEPPEYATVDTAYGLVGMGVPSETEGSGPIKFISRFNYKPACIIDYRIVLSKNPTDADRVREKGVQYQDVPRRGQSILPLSVLEPEPEGVDLGDCISHLAWKMYATAVVLKKATIRGALTDGSLWIFLILSADTDSTGTSYRCSYAFPSMNMESFCEDNSDTITGILASWIKRNCEQISDRDWLEYANKT